MYLSLAAKINSLWTSSYLLVTEDWDLELIPQEWVQGRSKITSKVWDFGWAQVKSSPYIFAARYGAPKGRIVKQRAESLSKTFYDNCVQLGAQHAKVMQYSRMVTRLCDQISRLSFICLSGVFLNKTLFKYNLTPNDQEWILVYGTWRVVLNFLLQKNWIGTPTCHAVTILRRWAHKRRDERWPSQFGALFSTLRLSGLLR